MSADETESERLIRIETKLDLVIGQHGDQLRDHEHRIRTLENKPTVSPKGLVGTGATIIAIIAGFIALMDRLFQ